MSKYIESKDVFISARPNEETFQRMLVRNELGRLGLREIIQALNKSQLLSEELQRIVDESFQGWIIEDFQRLLDLSEQEAG